MPATTKLYKGLISSMVVLSTGLFYSPGFQASASTPNSESPRTMTNSKSSKAINSLGKKLDSIQRRIDKLATNPRLHDPEFAESLANQIENYQSRLSDIKEKANEYNNSPNFAEFEVRFDTLTNTMAELMEKKDGPAPIAKEDLWETFRKSDEFNSDREKIRVYKNALEPYKFNPRQNKLVFRALHFPAEFNELVDLYGNLQGIEAELQTLQAKYQNFYDNSSRGAGATLDACKHGLQQIDKIKTKLDEAKSDGPHYMEEIAAALQDSIKDNFVRKKQTEDAGGLYHMDYILLKKEPALLATSIERIGEYLSIIDAQNAKKYENLTNESMQFYRQTLSDIEDDILANKEAAPDDYSGNDRDEIQKLVEKRFSQENVLSVRLSGNWQLEESMTIENGTAVKKKISKLDGVIYLEIDNDWALERWIHIEKDHNHNNSLRLYGDFREYPTLRPGQKLSRSKL